jgi:hypothetical protein
MIFKTVGAFLGVTLLTAGFASAKDSPEEKRKKIRKMAASTLADLYMREPNSKVAIQKSAGYAVFSNMDFAQFDVLSAPPVRRNLRNVKRSKALASRLREPAINTRRNGSQDWDALHGSQDSRDLVKDIILTTPSKSGFGY